MEDVQPFWKLLKKERRLRSFQNFDDQLKLDFLISKNFLDLDMKHRLWDNIGHASRLYVWNLSKKQEILETAKKDHPLCDSEWVEWNLQR